MEIKGAYSEQSQKTETPKTNIVEDYAPSVLPERNLSAGNFLKQQKDGVGFAFRFQKTEEQVRNEFFENMPKDASEKFVDSAKKSLKISRAYLPVEYFTVTLYEKLGIESTRHYGTTGYTAKGSVDGDTLKVDVSPTKGVTHTTYDIVTDTHKAKDKIYYTRFDEDLKVFSSKFYSTEDTDASNLASADEIMNDLVLPCRGAMFYHHPTYGSPKKWDIHQILLFPLWIIEVTLDDKVYVNYYSDIDNSQIAYYNRSTKHIAEFEKEKQAYSRLKTITGAVIYSVMVCIAISLLIHFFGSTTAADSKEYSGWLYRTLGGFGMLLTLAGGFSLIGYVISIVGFVLYFNTPNLEKQTHLKSSEVAMTRQNMKSAIPTLKKAAITAIIGAIAFIVETILFIMFM